jgi:purine nucleoside phosphorylase
MVIVLKDLILKLNFLQNSEYSFEKVKTIADFLLERIPEDLKPKFGIVCGSGLGGLADRLTKTKVFPYETIPFFPKSTGNIFEIIDFKTQSERLEEIAIHLCVHQIPWEASFRALLF